MPKLTERNITFAGNLGNGTVRSEYFLPPIAVGHLFLGSAGKRSENAGITKPRQVIPKLCETFLAGCDASEAGRIQATEGIGGHVFFCLFFEQEVRINISQK